MSFWDKLGSAWDHSLGALGGAWTDSMYSHATGKAAGGVVGGLEWLINSQASAGSGSEGDPSRLIGSGSASAEAYSQGVARPVSAATQVLGAQHDRNTFAGPEPIFSGQAWSDAWRQAAQHTDEQGNVIEGVSPGQAFVSNFVRDAPFDIGQVRGSAQYAFGDETAQDRNYFFHNTAQGRLSSGAVDAVLNIAGDPTNAAPAALKAARAASTEIKLEDRAGALDAASGRGSAANSAQARAAAKLKALFQETDSKSMAEMAMSPVFKDTGDAGAIAYFFDRANRAFPNDEVARHQAKADILGAAQGNGDSIKNVLAWQEDLGNEIQRLGQVPVQGEAATKFSWADHGYDMFHAVPEVPFSRTHREELDKEMTRLDNLISLAGSTDRIAGSNLDNVKENLSAHRLRESIVPDNLAGRATRVVWGTARTRVPGFVHVKDQTRGYNDIMSVIGQMKRSSPETKTRLVDNWVKAATTEERQATVKAIDEQVFVDAAAHYSKWSPGLDEKVARTLYEQFSQRRGAVLQHMGERLYSTADTEKFVHIVDPEEDISHLYSKPLLRTQIEDSQAILDPRVIDRILKRGTNRRLLERWARGNFMGEKATAITNMGAGGREMLDETATMLSKAWKDMALMRGAYPMRIQVDSQARQMVHLGVMKTMAGTWRKTAGVSHYLITNTEGEKSPFNFLKKGDQVGASAKLLMREEDHKGFNIAPARNLEDVGRIVRGIASRDGAAADLGNDIASGHLADHRATGDWVKIDTTDPKWTEHYVRVVQQIQTSPTAREALTTQDPQDLVRWIDENPEGRAEWAERASGPQSKQTWAAGVIAHVNRYLPTPELKAKVDDPKGTLDLFDHQAVKDRAASLPILKEKREALRQDVRDMTDEINDLKTQIAVAPERSAERRALRIQLRDLQDRRKNVRSARNDAKQEHIQAKNPLEGEVRANGLVEPMSVHGETYSPLNQTAWQKNYGNFRKGFYDLVADMPENILARHPIYNATFRQYMRDAIDRIGDADLVDQVGIERIRKAAVRRAEQEVGNVLFDSSHTSNLSHAMRFMAPFFSAWEDTMKKWGQLLYDNPEWLVFGNKLMDAPADSGLMQDELGNRLDDQGQAWSNKGQRVQRSGEDSYLVLPQQLTWPMRKVMAGVGLDPGDHQLRINTKSLNILFQGDPWWLPSTGPAVSVPTNYIVREAFPEAEDNPIIKYILPFGTDNNSASQVFPAWVKAARDAFGGTDNFAEAYAQNLAKATTIAQQQGKPMPDPSAVAKQTRNQFIMQAVLSNTAPVSARVGLDNKFQFYVDMGRKYRDLYGPKAQDKFAEDFPEYSLMDISLSANSTGLQAYAGVYDALKNKSIRSMVKNDPSMGWFFVGPANIGGEFSQGVYNWQRTNEAGKGLKFRDRKDPETALKDQQVSEGWTQYNSARTAVNLELEKRGLHSIQQKGAEDLQQDLSDYREYLMSENTAWRDEYGSIGPDKVAGLYHTAVDAWAKDKTFAQRSDQQSLKNYFEARAQVQEELAQRDAGGLTSESNSDLADMWGQYVQYLVQDNPVFENIYNRILERDDLSGEVLH